MYEPELLRWLDIIPGRSWLILGTEPAALARAVQAGFSPSSVAVYESYVESLPFDSGRFDVAVCALTEAVPLGLAAELRRLVWPAGTVVARAKSPPASLETVLRQAGLHAVQSRAFDDGSAAAKGVR